MATAGFRYRFRCADNTYPTHDMALKDWEAGASYRTFLRKYGERAVQDKLRERWYDSIFTRDRAVHFFVGNIAARSGTWTPSPGRCGSNEGGASPPAVAGAVVAARKARPIPCVCGGRVSVTKRGVRREITNGDWVSIDFETANYWPGSICSVGMTAVVAGKMLCGRSSTSPTAARWSPTTLLST